MNFDTLQSMGVTEDLAEAQLNNYKYDPEAETRLVTALASMKNVAGRDDVVARATLASSHSAANEMRDWVELLAAYHTKVERASKLVVIGSAPFLVDRKKRAHGIFPTDYVVWTSTLVAEIADLTKRITNAGYTPGTISVTGMIDPKVAKLLRSSGWTDVQANAETILRSK